jgi:ribosomal protein L31E
MKGEEAEYTIPLARAFNFPPTKRPRKAINAIKTFVYKHTRSKNTLITADLNKEIFKNSKNIPRKVKVMLRKEKDKIIVYLAGSKQIQEDRKKREEAKKKKEKPKKEVKTEKQEPAAEKSEEKKKEEKETKLKEKKEKEKSAQITDIKRKVKN